MKLENEVESLQNEVRRLRNQMAIDDMTHDELDDIQRILLESDDEDVDESSVQDSIQAENGDGAQENTLRMDGSSIDNEPDVNSNEEEETNDAVSFGHESNGNDASDNEEREINDGVSIGHESDGNGNEQSNVSSLLIESPQLDERGEAENAVSFNAETSFQSSGSSSQVADSNGRQNHVSTNAMAAATNSIFDSVAGYINMDIDVSMHI